MENIIKEYTFNDFRTFIQSISYGGALYNNFYPGYIFRGESSDKFKLIPSALRECNKERITQLANVRYADPINNITLISSEYIILRDFFYSCDNENLYVPTCSLREHPIDDISVYFSKDTWLPRDLFEIAGLAQHYGLPTRLLDWSQNIYVSLYFACVGAMKSLKTNSILDDHIVLWAINAKKIEEDKTIGKAIPMFFIRPSYHGNPNLGAQKGLFTLWEFVSFEQRNNIFVATPLDVFLQENAKDSSTLLYKLKLPIKFAPNLYCMLSRLGYHAANVFPGYQGVAQKMDEDLLYKEIISQHATHN